MEDMQELQKQYDILQEGFKNDGKKLLVKMLKSLFSHGYLKEIKWNQYTPSFNDGDPCSFTLTELKYNLVDTLKENSESLLECFYEEDEDYFCYSSYKEEERIENLSTEQKIFLSRLKEFQEFYDSGLFYELAKKVFGDDVKIIFNGEEFEIESEYYD